MRDCVTNQCFQLVLPITSVAQITEELWGHEGGEAAAAAVGGSNVAGHPEKNPGRLGGQGDLCPLNGD